MNIEKKLTQTSNSAGEYLAPKVKVVEIKASMVICQLSGSLGDIDKTDGSW